MGTPRLGRSTTGLIMFARPGEDLERARVWLGRINNERGYINFMGRIRLIFPDWKPEWTDLPSLREWAERQRAILPVPKSPDLPSGPVVYFIRMGDLIKIGHTTNLRSRVSGLSLTMDQVVATQPGGQEFEQELHARFAALRAFGEWFRAAPELLVYIAELKTTSPPNRAACLRSLELSKSPRSSVSPGSASTRS